MIARGFIFDGDVESGFFEVGFGDHGGGFHTVIFDPDF